MNAPNKELYLPVALVVGLLINAVGVSVAWGRMETRQEERFLADTANDAEIKESLRDIQAQLRDNERQQASIVRDLALLAARVAVAEKFIDGQAALNSRVLGHLDRYQQKGE